MRTFVYSILLIVLAHGFGHESLAQYTVSGRVYLDVNEDGALQGFDRPQGAVRINFYRDINADGTINGLDSIVASATTNGEGDYLVNLPVGIVKEFQISANNDDAEEQIADGSVNRGSTDLELGEDGTTPQIVGMRFQNISLANSETINYAFLTLVVDEADTEATSVTIKGEATNSSTGFSNAAFNLSSRTKTADSTNWNSIEDWVSIGNKYKSPNIGEIVDEIVSRAGWTSGNNMSFFIEGSGERTADSYDGSNANAVKLSVDFGTGDSTFIARIVTADLSTGHTITTTSSISLAFNAIGDTLKNQHFGYGGEAVTCFAVADGGDILYQINRFSGVDSIIASVSAPNIEAVTFDKSRLNIIGCDANDIGTIDKLSGGYSVRANPLGTAGGIDGEIALNDVDAIGMDATQDTLFGVFGIRLFVINSTTGAHVPNYFGSGVDYINITGASALDDIAVDPTSGTLYATQASNLYTINTSTGAASLVGSFGFADMEGMTFSEDGQLYGSTGTGAGGTNINAFWSIDKSTGSATKISNFSGSGTDFEGCECLAGSSLAGILPVRLNSFSAKALETGIELNWSTLSESRNSHFILQRSKDAFYFESIKEIPGSLYSNSLHKYRTLDLEPEDGFNYYRLIQVDSEGAFEFSSIVSEKWGVQGSTEQFSFHPNPNHGNLIVERNDLELFDLNGRRVLRLELGHNDLSRLRPGLYIVKNSSGKSEKLVLD